MDTPSEFIVIFDQQNQQPSAEELAQKRKELQQRQQLHQTLEKARQVILAELEQQLHGKTDLTKPEAERLVRRILSESQLGIPHTQTDQFIEQIVNDVAGFGPLEDPLHDPNVTEIWGYGYNRIMIEKSGRKIRTDLTFRDDHHLRTVLERILAPLGKRLDESNTIVDARLPSGERLNVVIQPTAVDGTQFTIRRFIRGLTLQELMKRNYISTRGANFLKACVTGRANLLVCGGTSSGKTTLLNALSEFFAQDESIVVIEDPAELQLQGSWVRRFEASETVPVRRLVQNALRQNPDRIIVGEVRDGTAADMLQAMLTGHAGSMSTVHADTPEIALNDRMQELVLEGRPQLDPQLALRQIADALHVVIQVENTEGFRHVAQIAEVLGYDEQARAVQTQPLFLWEDGELHPKNQPSQRLLRHTAHFGQDILKAYTKEAASV